MKDINGEEFLVGDSLKVIKLAYCGADLKVGDVLECIKDDRSLACRFKLLSTGEAFYYYNNYLQKL